jgi:hypothetical protein
MDLSKRYPKLLLYPTAEVSMENSWHSFTPLSSNKSHPVALLIPGAVHFYQHVSA